MMIWSRIDSRRVFVDASAHFALADHHDGWHAEAQSIATQLATARRFLFTTNFVVAEAHALLVNRSNRTAGVAFLRRIDRASTTVVRVAAADERRARDIIEQYDDKDFSLTDAISFAVMERLRIGQAFTFD